jgi:hypothetical protein
MVNRPRAPDGAATAFSDTIGAMKEIAPLLDQEPATTAWQGSLAHAMARRDVQLDAAVTAVRAAAESAALSVDALMGVATPDARFRPASLAAAESPPPTGFVSVAQQLHDIALQLRVIEASVRKALERQRRQAEQKG